MQHGVGCSLPVGGIWLNPEGGTAPLLLAMYGTAPSCGSNQTQEPVVHVTTLNYTWQNMHKPLQD